MFIQFCTRKFIIDTETAFRYLCYHVSTGNSSRYKTVFLLFLFKAVCLTHPYLLTLLSNYMCNKPIFLIFCTQINDSKVLKHTKIYVSSNGDLRLKKNAHFFYLVTDYIANQLVFMKFLSSVYYI